MLEEFSKKVSLNSVKAINSLLGKLYEFEPKKKEELLDIIDKEELTQIYKKDLPELNIDVTFDFMKNFNKDITNEVFFSLST